MMKIFNRKESASANEGEASKRNAKADVYRPRGIETVCPESGSSQQTFYLAPAQALGERLASLPLILHGGDDQPTRLQWQFAIAIEAINTLDNYPLQAVVNVHGEDKWDFHRAAFLRALVAGLGDWLNKHQLKTKKGVLVDVLLDGWGEGVNLAPAKETFIPVNSGLTEWQLCNEIIQDNPKNYLHPEVYRLFMDSFATDYHPRNPIAGAVHQARGKMVKRLNGKGVALHQAVGVVPKKLKTVSTSAPSNTPSSETNADEAKAEVKAQPKQQERPKQKASSGSGRGSQDRKSKPSTPSPNAVHKAGIAMPGESGPVSRPVTDNPSSAKPAAVSPSPDQSAAEPIILDDLVRVVRQRMDEGIITTNQAGAIFHGTPNGAALIVPKGYDVIAQVMKVEMADVEALARNHLVNSDLSSPNVVYRLHRKGRGWAKIKAGVLSSQAASMLFPEGLEANPDIKTE